MRIASYAQDSIVDGPGLRFTLFTQGCPHRCLGCHNPATHDFDGGVELAVSDIIRELLSNPLTDGLTLSGGEPFAQAADCAAVARAARLAGLSVWAYTGYVFERLAGWDTATGAAAGTENIDGAEAAALPELPGAAELLALCDVLVDGVFELPLRSLSLAWRGSGNQRVIDVAASLAAGSVRLWEPKS